MSLDPKTAEDVTEVWRRMLLKVQYPQKPESGFITDTTSIHFSRAMPFDHPGKDVRLGGVEQGYLKTPSIDPRGPLTTRLIAIGMALKTYCARRG